MSRHPQLGASGSVSALRPRTLVVMTGSREVYVRVGGLKEVVRCQRGVVTRSQLAGLGVGPPEVACHLAALRWRALSEQVLVTHRGRSPGPDGGGLPSSAHPRAA